MSAEQEQPSAVLNASWEKFAEEFAAVRERSPLQFAWMAFFAGAQSFCAAMNEALDDEVGEAENERKMDALLKELASNLEELKL